MAVRRGSWRNASDSTLDYARALEVARDELNVSLAQLQERMTALGHSVSVKRLEQLVYEPRRLNVRGRARLEQVADALQDLARQQGKDSASYLPHRLFPHYFAAPAPAAPQPPAGRASGASQFAGHGTDGPSGGRPALVHATVLFIDLMNSVALSTALSLWEYNALINEYQQVLKAVIAAISESYKVAEWYLGGDQLAVFFYNADDAGLHEKAVELRRQRAGSPKASAIDAQLTANRNRGLYGALRCAVNVKNAWIAHPRNVARVETDQPVLDVGIGIHSGNVVLQRRSSGELRIEGFAINYAKRVEGFSRHGEFCKIMLSKEAYEIFRGIVVEEAMLKQRAFFERFVPGAGVLKGLPPGTEVYELKFFHRLAGFSIGAAEIPLFRQIFENDPSNIWAYANLMNHHLFVMHDLSESQRIAEIALYSNPRNEKIYYDLAVIANERGQASLAREYCHQCLRLNAQMDIACHLLSEIERGQPEGFSRALDYMAQALALSPSCADYHYDYALLLAMLGRADEAREQAKTAETLFPRIWEKYPYYKTNLEAELVVGAKRTE